MNDTDILSFCIKKKEEIQDPNTDYIENNIGNMKNRGNSFISILEVSQCNKNIPLKLY